MASTWGQSWGTSWGAAWDAELVEVPSVVGETEASATSSLEGDGFVVAVETAYSNVVEAGLVISQVPAGGEFANSGSTVVITVSRGPKPEEDESPTGGWLFMNMYEAELQRRRREKEEREELERLTEGIEDALDRSIARLLREQEAKDAKRAEMERLAKLAKQNADIQAARAYSERVAAAFQSALEKGNFSALERLDRELQRAREEEEFLLLAMIQVLD